MRHFCLLAKFIHIHNQLTHEKRQLCPSQVSSIDVDSTVLMGNQSCSSVTSSQDTQQCSHFRKSKRRWKKGRGQPEKWKHQKNESKKSTNLSSCRYTRTLMERFPWFLVGRRQHPSTSRLFSHFGRLHVMPSHGHCPLRTCVPGRVSAARVLVIPLRRNLRFFCHVPPWEFRCL